MGFRGSRLVPRCEKSREYVSFYLLVLQDALMFRHTADGGRELNVTYGGELSSLHRYLHSLGGETDTAVGIYFVY